MTVLAPDVALLDGLAWLLQEAGAGEYGGLDAGAYPLDAECPIALGGLLTDRQSIAVTLTTDTPLDRSSTRRGFQVRLRLAPSDMRQLPRVGTVRDALHGRTHPPMPEGIRVTSIALNGSGGYLGRFGGWDEHSLNFTALCPRAFAWAGGAVY